MAPNGTTSRKSTPSSFLCRKPHLTHPTAPAPPKPVKNEEGSIPLGNLFDDLEHAGPNVKDDLRKGLPALEKPGTWESKVTGGIYHMQPIYTHMLTAMAGAKKDDKPDRTSSSAMNKLPTNPPNLSRAFPNGKLLADKPEVLKCNHCKRPVLKHAMPGHIERCLNKKQEKQRKKKEAKDARDAAARKEKSQGDSDAEGEDEVAVAPGKTNMAGKGGTMTASKKRKAIDEGEDAAGPPSKKKKKKDADKAKAPRPKAPVDVEKQCGVELPQGGQCARSLTCKSHSMGAKRGVPGRSAPYDKLLLEYQRKNQAKLQKAAFDANAPNPDDDSLPTGPIDSEEEKDAVMAAIARSWGGAPIYQPQPVPLKSKYQYNRFKGMLSSALGNRPAGGGGLFGSGGGTGFFGNTIEAPAPAQPMVDADGVVHPAKRGSVVPGARSMMAPAAAARKPSVAT